MNLIDMRRLLRAWLDWRAERKREQALKDAERARQATMRAIERRREKHEAFRYLEGNLRNATCRSLAASCGREWGT